MPRSTFAPQPPGSPRLLAPAAGAALVAALALVAAPRPVGPAPAFAHVSVVSKRPAPGRTVAPSTTTAAVVFAGEIRSARITVTGPGARKVSGPTRRDAANAQRFTARLTGPLRAGRYRARLSYTPRDGHPARTSWTFRVSP